MTQEEKEKYNTIIEYNIDGIEYKSKTSASGNADFNKLEGEERWDSIIKFIKYCVDYDLKEIKKRLMENEVR